jgi:hypothetical protein
LKRIGRLWNDIRYSLWFIPSVILAVATALAIAAIELDSTISADTLAKWPKLFGASADGARIVLQVVSSAMITVAGLTFSITILILSLAGTNYTGDMLNLIGPVSIDDMNKVGPFGIDWKNKIRSLETGKAATLTVYDNVNYRDQVGQFNPGRKVSEVSKVVGFFDEFSSVKLTCSKK